MQCGHVESPQGAQEFRGGDVAIEEGNATKEVVEEGECMLWSGAYAMRGSWQ